MTSPNTILFELFNKQICFKSTGSEASKYKKRTKESPSVFFFFLNHLNLQALPASFKQSVSCQTHGCLQLFSCQAALFGCPPNLHPRHSRGTQTEVTIPLTPLGYCVTTCRATRSITLTVFRLTGGRKVARKTANRCSGLPAWHEATIFGDERPGGLPLG